LPPQEAFPRAREAALKAVSMDDALAEAHATLAMIGFLYDWDWPTADQGFRRSIALGPNIATIRAWYALYLLAMGRVEESLQEIQRGLALEPLGNLTNVMIAWYCYVIREYDQAIAQFRKTIELHPDSFPVHFLLGAAYLAKSRVDDAIAAFEKAAQLSGIEYPAGFLGVAYAMSGQHDKVIQLVNELREKSRRTYISAGTFAILSLALGDINQMFQWLEKAYEERYGDLAMLKCIHAFDPLRPDPRFQSLVARMNFPS
jgi:tetratricopeptide (TPR) repeat protein